MEADSRGGHMPVGCPAWLQHPCRHAQAQAGAAEAGARADAAEARARELADEAAAARAELAAAREEASGAANAAAAAAAAQLAAVRGAADGAAAERAAADAKAKADMKARAGLQGLKLWHCQRMGCRQGQLIAPEQRQTQAGRAIWPCVIEDQNCIDLRHHPRRSPRRACPASLVA